METYRKILVPLDGSPLAETVLPHVKLISSSCRPGGITLARVVEPILWPVGPGIDISPEVAQRIQTEQRKDAQEYLHLVRERLSREGIEASSEVLFGYAADALAAWAEGNGVDLIILATHGRSGIGRWVWGSVADRMMRSSCIPVMIVRVAGCAERPAGASKAAAGAS